MCIKRRLTKAELAKFKKTLPKEFPVWKVVARLLVTEYQGKNEPCLQPGVNKAGHFGSNRMRIKYKVGYHAFLTPYCARKYKNQCGYCYRIQKFYAKRTWVTAAGKSLHHREYPQPIVVLSHIEVRGRKAKAG